MARQILSPHRGELALVRAELELERLGLARCLGRRCKQGLNGLTEQLSWLSDSRRTRRGAIWLQPVLPLLLFLVGAPAALRRVLQVLQHSERIIERRVSRHATTPSAAGCKLSKRREKETCLMHLRSVLGHPEAILG